MKKISIICLLLSMSFAYAEEQAQTGQTQQAQASPSQQPPQSCADQFRDITNGPDKERAIQSCNQHQATIQALQGSNQNGNNVPYNDCRQSLALTPTPVTVGPTEVAGLKYCQSAQGAQETCPAATPNTAAGAWMMPGIQKAQTPQLKICRGYEGIANSFGSDLQGVDRRDSQDRKIFCVRKSGITADWESCTSALSMYDSIVVAEAAMQIFQGVQQNNAQNKAQDQYNQRAANGDAQNAAYDAQVSTVNSAKQLNQQQAMAYTAAVAALFAKVQGWIKEDKQTLLQKGCSARTPAPATPAENKVYASKDAVSKQANCAAAVEQGFEPYKGYIFANRAAKAAFTTAAMMYAAKAIAAGIKASQLGNIAKKVEEAKKQTEDQYDAPTFERCQLTPNDPACAGAVTRTSGSGLQDGGFGFGDSFGNNAFSPLGDEEKLGDIAPLPLPGSDTVADVSNPFADDAKNASGIVDPASAASVQPGAAGGGGGGGGAPGGGGGSASLGNDTPGADDSKKENDIKANKADGKYNIAGGGAFQAVKPMKDENPFANLFDGKGGGKLEEDRSIASGDIDGQDSGLFSKISKRYGQVQADKRIEAKNLEE